MSLKFIKRCPHLRNGLVRPVFALYVIAGGHVPTESGRRQTARGGSTGKRFDTAAEALRFAVEEIAAPALMGAYLEVDEERFGTQEIRYLYENAAYPVTRPKMLSGVRGVGHTDDT